jgi:RNA polymerase sigma factor (sigma-70 family)
MTNSGFPMSPVPIERTLAGMDAERDDAGLLREYARTGSRDALGELARRHAGMVYAAARRQVGDLHLAEDVTQAVFILLSENASSIGDPARLVGWLYRTTRFAAANAMKIERRRKNYESKAGLEMARCADEMDEKRQWQQLSPILDEAMAQLGQTDRQTILLRYFSGFTVRETARAMAVSEDAAKKRISRGLDKLRRILGSSGLVISAIALTAALESRAAEPAPPTLEHVVRAVVRGNTGAASKTAATIARNSVHFWTWPVVGAASAASTLLIVLALWQIMGLQSAPAARAQNAVASTAPSPVTSPSIVQNDSGPPLLSVSGAIVGGPMVADLLGDGKKEIVLCYMKMIDYGADKNAKLVEGEDYSAYVGAFHLDGTPLPGWPVKAMSSADHEAAKPSEYPNWWKCTPAVVPALGGSPGFVVVSRPSGAYKRDRGAMVVRADGNVRKLPTSLAMPDPGTTLTLVDLNGGGQVDVVGGGTVCSISGSPVVGWRAGKMAGGFSGSAGDVTGDGHIRMFVVGERHGASNATVWGLDAAGKMFGSWPQKIGLKTFAPPSLGNVFGDGKMEVVVPDFRGHIMAWTWDGRSFGNCKPQDVAQSADGSELPQATQEHERCQSIFKDDVRCAGPVSLADLDGDGLAEVIAVDGKTNTLRAWHGDGTGFGNADGIIAHLGSGDVEGVSVAGPDESGGFDFFAGAWWVHRDKNGDVQTRLMAPKLPGAPLAQEAVGEDSTALAAPDTQCQDTITDLYGDGKAEVLIATSDGRMYAFPTGVTYSAAWAQWPMFGRNMQHTSCWRKD